MKYQRDKPVLSNRKGSELPLSGQALLELLQAILARGLPFRFRARGLSMFPFIRDGDIITVSPLAGNMPRIGDVLAFTHPETGKLLVHRIVGITGIFFLPKGDNGFYIDGFVPKEGILGCVTNVERDGKVRLLGFGPERLLIACLSRMGILRPLLSRIWRHIRPVVRR